MKQLGILSILCVFTLALYHNQKEINQAIEKKSPIEDIKNFKRTTLNKKDHSNKRKTSDSKSVEAKLAIESKIETSRDFSYISSKLKKNKFWKQFSDYSLLTEEMLSDQSIDQKEIIELSKDVIAEVKKCLPEFCGIKSESPRGYFDPERTEAHDLIERSLSILSVLSQFHQIDLNKSDIDSLMNIPNENIQSLAVELAIDDNVTDEDFNHIVKNMKKFKGPSKASAFVTLEKESLINNERRSLYLNELSSTLSMDGLHGIESAKKLQFVKLDKKELIQVSKGACLLKRRPANSHNWKAVNYHLNNYAEGRGIDLDWDKICK